jgi:hypothetical protein
MAGVHLPFPPGIEVPTLTEVALAVPNPPPVTDVEATTHAAVARRLAAVVQPGMTVAVGGGSRGLTDRVPLVRGTISGLRALGAEPFVIPAMGSHGGATADGQRAMLAELGMTEASLGCEIRATMETVEVARTPPMADGHTMPLYLDRHAASAHRILPVNRTKPHTCFKGPIESGCAKMTVVGMGKQPGAAQIHACGPVQMRDRILAGIAAIRATGRLLGGVSSVESATGAIARIEAMTADEVGGQFERELTDYARSLIPTLPFEQIDTLIIELGGKDISGTTMDPNVTGRFWVPGLADGERPNVNTIVLLGLTEISGGNALGIGFADFIPASLAAQLDFAKTYINCFTAGPAGLRRSRMPMVLPTEDDCIKAALCMCGRGFEEPKRVVRIRSTLHLTRCWVSEAMLPLLPPGARVVG